jgi:ATP-dependent Lhr-like helicase
VLRPEAVAEVRSHLQHTAPTAQARTADELGVLLQQMGDLSPSELAAICVVDPSAWITRLAGEGRILLHTIPTAHGPEDRWIAAEYKEEYNEVFPPTLPTVPTFSTVLSPPAHLADLPIYQFTEAAQHILERYLRHAGPVTIGAIRRRYDFPADWLQAELDRLVADRKLASGQLTPQPSGLRITHYESGQAPAPEPEYVDRSALEHIHRRTLSILRQEVQPVSFAVYADFLARWQHVHPAERWDGSGALTQALQQLRAVALPGVVWERDVLPLRLAHFDPRELAALCQSGELVWIGSGEAAARRARIRLLFRGEGSAFLSPAPADLSGLSEEAQAVYRFLQAEGAVFFADIAAALELNAELAEAALAELVLAGVATCDSLDAMRSLIRRGAPVDASGHRPLSPLEADLAERLGPRGRPSGVRGRPRQSELAAARRRVRERLETAPAAALSGRWTLVHRFGILGKALPAEERIARQARQLLARHGVVTRRGLDAADNDWEWEPIYRHLQRLEMRGEVRRGYFVQGLPGVQFALPEVVERLRAVRGQGEDQAVMVLNACDPANLYGSAQDGGPETADGGRRPSLPRGADSGALTFARVPSTWVVQQRGMPVLLAEDTGGRLTTVQGAGEAMLESALRALVAHLASFQWRVTVNTWDDQPVLESAGQPLLESTGFYRDYPGMTWERPMQT